MAGPAYPLLAEHGEAEWHAFIGKVNHIDQEAGTHGALEVKATDEIVEVLPRGAPDKGTAP